MADVTITFGAVDQGLTATIANLKNQVVSLRETHGGTGFEVVARNANQAAGAINNVAQAQNNVAQASSHAGNMVERMFERMVIRAGIALAVFGTIKELFGMIGEAINFEKAEAQFRHLIGNADDFAYSMAKVNEESKLTGTSKEDLMGIDEALKRSGISAHEAADMMQTLDQYAKVTGEDAKKLASEFAAVKLGRGSIQDMLDLTAAMGSAGEALHQQVVGYQQMQTQMERVRLDEQYSNALQDRQWQLEDRQHEHAWIAYDRQRESIDKLTDAQVQFADKVGITDKIFQAMQRGQAASQAPRDVSYVAGRDLGGRAAAVAGQRLEAGERQIEQEEQISQRDLKALERAGLITAKDLEAAGNRRREAQERAEREAREDQRLEERERREDIRFDRQMKNLDREMTLMQGLVQAQKDIAAAIEKRAGLEGGLAKEQETAASNLEKFGTTLKGILDNMPQVTQAIANLANTATEFITKHQGVIETMANLIAGIVQGMASAIGGVGKLIDDIKEKFPGMVSAIKDFVKNIGPAFTDFVSELTKNIDEALGEIKDMIQTITDILQKLFDMLPNMAKQAQTVVENINKAVPVLPRAPYGGQQPWETPQPAPGRGHEEITREREAGGLATEPTLKELATYLKGLFTVSATP